MLLFNEGEYVSRVYQMLWVHKDASVPWLMEWVAYLVRRPDGAWAVREKLLKSDGRGIPFDPNDEELKREVPVDSETAGVALLSTGSEGLVRALGRPRKVTQLAPKTNKMKHLIFKLAKAKLVNVLRVDKDTGEATVQASDDIVREMTAN